METYRILGGLHRHGIQGDQEIELIMGANEREEGGNENEEEDEKMNSGEKKKKKRILKFTDGQGEKTLDKEENINLVSLDNEIMVDPLFR